MKSENIISLNIPNVFTIGIILLIWVVLWAIIGQGVKRTMNGSSLADVASAGLGAATGVSG